MIHPYSCGVLPCLSLLLALQGEPLHSVAATSAADRIQSPPTHVLIISIDGLRSDALDPAEHLTVPAGDPGLSANPTTPTLPAFTRLLQGAHTLNARCDAAISVTLPNHVGMVTGRPYQGADGHAYGLNDLPPHPSAGGLVRPSPNRYIASCFDVAHDAGLSTAVIASKLKFSLLPQTWGDDYGAPDTDSRGGDNGKNKIDTFTFAENMPRVTDAVIDALSLSSPGEPGGSTLILAHYALPDSVGHTHGWTTEPNSPYMESVRAIDAELGRLLAAIDGSSELNDSTAIILTSDHGGGVPFKTHTDAAALVNFRIPFIVWVDGQERAADLYALNAETRSDPGNAIGTEMSPNATALPPIRNADAGNAALQLLGLEQIPGSTHALTRCASPPRD